MASHIYCKPSRAVAHVLPGISGQGGFSGKGVAVSHCQLTLIIAITRGPCQGEELVGPTASVAVEFGDRLPEFKSSTSKLCHLLKDEMRHIKMLKCLSKNWLELSSIQSST